MVLRGEGERVTFTSSTGFVSWETEDATDLDYSPLPLATRLNNEDDFQFTQEVRAASGVNAPVQLSEAVSMKWQAGAMLFTQSYDQVAVNSLAPFVLSPARQLPRVAVLARLEPRRPRHRPFRSGRIHTFGRSWTSPWGRATTTKTGTRAWTRYYVPAIAPPATVDDGQSFSNTSPQLAVGYRFRPDVMAYASVSQGFKAGGWNPASPPGLEAYDEEHAWHFESGVKGSLAGGKVAASAAMFAIDWSDLQLNVPNPAVPGQFYIANVGEADSAGVEFEVAAKPHPTTELFGNIGFTSAHFGNNTFSSGVDVSDNRVPNTPSYTAAFGANVESRSRMRSRSTAVPKRCSTARWSTTMPTPRARRRTRW